MTAAVTGGAVPSDVEGDDDAELVSVGVATTSGTEPCPVVHPARTAIDTAAAVTTPVLIPINLGRPRPSNGSRPNAHSVTASGQPTGGPRNYPHDKQLRAFLSTCPRPSGRSGSHSTVTGYSNGPERP